MCAAKEGAVKFEGQHDRRSEGTLLAQALPRLVGAPVVSQYRRHHTQIRPRRISGGIKEWRDMRSGSRNKLTENQTSETAWAKSEGMP